MNFRRLFPVLAVLMAVVTGFAQPRDRRDDRGYDHDRDDRRGPRVIVYQDADYRGDRRVFYPGDSIENLSGLTFESGGRINDRISSIRIEGGAEIYVYADPRFSGHVMRLTDDARDLTGRLLPGSVSTSWNDRISSLRIEVRRRDERREDPDLIVKRAFRDLLGRDPDPAGLRDYRSLIIDQGWSEVMVRDNIRRGDEFRREGADRIIRRAYLDVLGREPDPTGLRDFRYKLLERNWTEGDVRDALRKSEEFRNGPRHRLTAVAWPWVINLP
jgi:hypothetical protein